MVWGQKGAFHLEPSMLTKVEVLEGVYAYGDG